MNNKNNKQTAKKSYMVDGLQIYITGVYSVEDALAVCMMCRYGICAKNLIEVERVPEGVTHYGIYNKPDFDPRVAMCIDMDLEYEHDRETIY